MLQNAVQATISCLLPAMLGPVSADQELPWQANVVLQACSRDTLGDGNRMLRRASFEKTWINHCAEHVWQP